MVPGSPLIAMLAGGFGLAFVLGLVANRLRLSPLVGYLLAGVVVGPFTPGLHADLAIAGELAEVGVILLMFGVGLHFSVEDLAEVRVIAVVGALAGIATASLLGFALAMWLGWSTLQGIVFGLSLSVASTVVLLRTLEERRLLHTARGKLAIGWVVIEDLVMVLVLVLLPALATAFAAPALGVGKLAAALALTVGKLLALAGLMLVVGRRVVPWLLEKVAGTGSRELFTLSILSIALGVAYGSARMFGVSFALGAFFAGMLLNESKLSQKAASDTLPLRDAFAVLFFVSVGMLFDPRILVEKPLEILAVFAIITVGKPFVAWHTVRRFGRPELTASTLAGALAQIGEFSFILAGLGVSLAILPAEARDLVLAGALLSILVNPMLIAALLRWQDRRSAPTPSLASISASPALPLPARDHTIVVGYGRVGRQLALLLYQRDVSLVVIDSDSDLIDIARRDGIAGIRGNAAAQETLEAASPAWARNALLAIPNSFEAGEIAARLRAANPAITILARAHSEAEVRHLLNHGADGTVLAEHELAYSMAEMVLGAPRS